MPDRSATKVHPSASATAKPWQPAGRAYFWLPLKALP
jgi:hypothetical protein